MKKRLSLVVFSIVLLIAVFAALLPAIISSDAAKEYAIKMVNQRISGRLNIVDWSLHWFRAIQLSGLEYADENGRYRVKAEQITLSAGLLKLIGNYRRPGQVNILNPEIIFYASIKRPAIKDKKNQGAGSLINQTKTTEKREDYTKKNGNGSSSESLLSLPIFETDLKLSGGKVNVIYAGKNGETILVEDLMMDLRIGAPGKPLTYRLLARSGDGRGRITGQGKLVIPGEIPTAINDTIQSKADITISDWDLAPVLSLTAALRGTPSGEGELNGRFSIIGDSPAALKFTGKLTGTNIRLAGGLLGTDTPQIENIDTEIDIIRSEDTLIINRLGFETLAATGLVSGRIEANEKRRISTKATLNLAEIFRQIPHTLRLQKGTTITHGRLDLNVKVSSERNDTYFEATLDVAKLRGRRMDKPVSWNLPLHGSMDGSYGEKGLHLKRFALDSAFLKGEGKGNLADFGLSIEADVQSALKETGKFINLNGWQGTGQLTATLSAKGISAGRHAIETKLDFNGFGLARKKEIIVPKKPLALLAKFEIEPDNDLHVLSFTRPSIQIESWLGKGQMTANQIKWPEQGVLPVLTDGTLQADIALGALTKFFHRLNLWADDLKMKGKAAIKTRFASSLESLSFEDLSMLLANFAYQQADRELRDKRVALSSNGQINLGDKSATLAPLNIQLSGGTITIPEMVVVDWEKDIPSFKCAATASLDIASIMELFGEQGPQLGQAKVSGKGKIKIKTDLSDTARQTLRLESSFSPLKIISLKKPFWDEEKVEFNLDLSGDLNAKTMSIEKLDVISKSLTVRANGQLRPSGNELILKSKGDLTIELDRWQTLLNDRLGTDWIFKGKSKRLFSIQLSTVNGQWRNMRENIDLTASLQAEQIEGMGMVLTAVNIPFTIKKSTAFADMGGSLNGGELRLQPMIRLADENGQLILPSNSKILTGVNINESLANRLLTRIHPIFKGTTAAQGKVDLVMHQMAWPLDESLRDEAQFSGLLNFRDVRINAEGLLYDLLALMKVDERDIYLDERHMEFSAKNGRVRCDPLRITVNKYRLEIGGTMGFDGTLDYVARIPLTQEIVGKKVYPYVHDTHIDIPVRGTLDHPKMSLDEFTATVKQVIRRSAGRILEKKAEDLLKKLLK